jgi:hypothetical protein
MSFHIDHVQNSLLITAAEVREKLVEGDKSVCVLTSLAEQLEESIGSLDSQTVLILCPKLHACDGSCFASGQGVWSACKDTLLAASESVL